MALLLLAGSPDGDDSVAFRLPNKLRRALAIEPSSFLIGLTVAAVAGVLLFGEVGDIQLAVGRATAPVLAILLCGARAGVDCEATARGVEAVVTGTFAAWVLKDDPEFET